MLSLRRVCSALRKWWFYHRTILDCLPGTMRSTAVISIASTRPRVSPLTSTRPRPTTAGGKWFESTAAHPPGPEPWPSDVSFGDVVCSSCFRLWADDPLRDASETSHERMIKSVVIGPNEVEDASDEFDPGVQIV